MINVAPPAFTSNPAFTSLLEMPLPSRKSTPRGALGQARDNEAPDVEIARLRRESAGGPQSFGEFDDPQNADLSNMSYQSFRPPENDYEPEQFQPENFEGPDFTWDPIRQPSIAPEDIRRVTRSPSAGPGRSGLPSALDFEEAIDISLFPSPLMVFDSRAQTAEQLQQQSMVQDTQTQTDSGSSALHKNTITARNVLREQLPATETAPTLSFADLSSGVRLPSSSRSAAFLTIFSRLEEQHLRSSLSY